MRRILATLLATTQLQPLIGVALCVGLGVAAPGRDEDCQSAPTHDEGQHGAAVDPTPELFAVDAGSHGEEVAGCPVATACAPVPVAPVLVAPHALTASPVEGPIVVRATTIASFGSLPPPTPPPNS